jgi:hypothetical protein
MDTLEFYSGSQLLGRVQSSFVPLIGQAVSIRRQTWWVTGVTFALDHADEAELKSLRCNVDVEQRAVTEDKEPQS